MVLKANACTAGHISSSRKNDMGHAMPLCCAYMWSRLWGKSLPDLARTVIRAPSQSLESWHLGTPPIPLFPLFPLFPLLEYFAIQKFPLLAQAFPLGWNRAMSLPFSIFLVQVVGCPADFTPPSSLFGDLKTAGPEKRVRWARAPGALTKPRARTHRGGESPGPFQRSVWCRT